LVIHLDHQSVVLDQILGVLTEILKVDLIGCKDLLELSQSNSLLDQVSTNRDVDLCVFFVILLTDFRPDEVLIVVDIFLGFFSFLEIVEEGTDYSCLLGSIFAVLT
jgi:hypothetical protein